MNKEQIFLTILRDFIHPEQKIEAEYELSEEEWDQILRLAMDHGILPILFDAVWKQASFQKCSEKIKQYYKQRTRQLVIIQTHRTSLFLILYQEMRENGLDPILMKGLILRNMYPVPDFRMSGDEDLLIRRKDFDRMDAFLLERGYTRDEVNDPDRVHEVSYFQMEQGMHLEMHLSLFEETDAACGCLNDEFEDIFGRSEEIRIQNVSIRTMDATQHMLYLLCHGLKHFLHSGFGIRQVCDMILFAEQYGEKINWKDIEKSTKRQDMYVMWMNLFDIGERYLGFSWEKAGLTRPDRKLLESEELLDEILNAGLFGQKQEARIHSSNITLQAVTENKGCFGLRQALFPGKQYMMQKYPYVREHRWKLPIAWIHRLVDYIKAMHIKGMKDTIRIGRKRVDLLKKYKIMK